MQLVQIINATTPPASFGHNDESTQVQLSVCLSVCRSVGRSLFLLSFFLPLSKCVQTCQSLNPAMRQTNNNYKSQYYRYAKWLTVPNRRKWHVARTKRQRQLSCGSYPSIKTVVATVNNKSNGACALTLEFPRKSFYGSLVSFVGRQNRRVDGDHSAFFLARCAKWFNTSQSLPIEIPWHCSRQIILFKMFPNSWACSQILWDFQDSSECYGVRVVLSDTRDFSENSSSSLPRFFCPTLSRLSSTIFKFLYAFLKSLQYC